MPKYFDTAPLAADFLPYARPIDAALSGIRFHKTKRERAGHTPSVAALLRDSKSRMDAAGVRIICQGYAEPAMKETIQRKSR